MKSRHRVVEESLRAVESPRESLETRWRVVELLLRPRPGRVSFLASPTLVTPSSRFGTPPVFLEMAAIRAEACALLRLSWPLFAAGVAEAGLVTVASLFLGRDPDEAIIGGALVAFSVFNVFARSPMAGLSSAASTLVANAVGAGEVTKIGAYVQLGTAVNLAYAALVIVPLVGFPKPLLTLVLGGEQPSVTAVAATYIRLYAWALLPYALTDPFQQALTAQSVTWPLMLSSVTAVASSAAFHALFVFAAGWGAVGSAVATVLAATAQTVCLTAIIAARRLGPTVWGRWSPAAAWSSARAYLRLAIPGAAVLCAEWWALEVTTFLMARFASATALTAHVIAMNVAYLTYMAPSSLGIAAMARVGNTLGGRDPEAARRTCWVAAGLGVAAGIAQAASLFAAQNVWPRLYSSSDDVQGLLGGFALLLAAFVAVDAALNVFGRVLRGSGRQLLCATIYVVGYWGGVLPLAGILAAAGGGMAAAALRGMWIGLAGGKLGLVVVMLSVAVVTDWEDQSRRALARLELDPMPVSDPGSGLENGDANGEA